MSDYTLAKLRKRPTEEVKEILFSCDRALALTGSRKGRRNEERLAARCEKVLTERAAAEGKESMWG